MNALYQYYNPIHKFSVRQYWSNESMKTGNLRNDDGNGVKNVTQKWIRAVSNFIAFIPAPLICQMLAIFQELNSKGMYLSSLKQKENRCLCSRPPKNVKFTSVSCSDGKEMYKKTCKVVVLVGTVGWRIQVMFTLYRKHFAQAQKSSE